ERVLDTSPFYRRKYAGAPNVRTRRDLANLPFTEKDELRRALEVAPPLGENQGAPREEIVRLAATGGTTGVPMLLAFTASDLRNFDELGARAAWCAGARPGDVVFNCMNYSLYVGGVIDGLGFERAGVCVAPYSVGNSLRLLE